MTTYWHENGVRHTVETRHDVDGTWALYVDDKPLIVQESAGVVFAVEDALVRNPHTISEAGEVADNIRASRT